MHNDERKLYQHDLRSDRIKNLHPHMPTEKGLDNPNPLIESSGALSPPLIPDLYGTTCFIFGLLAFLICFEIWFKNKFFPIDGFYSTPYLTIVFALLVTVLRFRRISKQLLAIQRAHQILEQPERIQEQAQIGIYAKGWPHLQVSVPTADGKIEYHTLIPSGHNSRSDSELTPQTTLQPMNKNEIDSFLTTVNQPLNLTDVMERKAATNSRLPINYIDDLELVVATLYRDLHTRALVAVHIGNALYAVWKPSFSVRVRHYHERS